jgi:hypothetical protein
MRKAWILSLVIVFSACYREDPKTAKEIADLRQEVRQLSGRVNDATNTTAVREVGRFELRIPPGAGPSLLFDTATGRLFHSGVDQNGKAIWVEMQQPPHESNPVGAPLPTTALSPAAASYLKSIGQPPTSATHRYVPGKGIVPIHPKR